MLTSSSGRWTSRLEVVFDQRYHHHGLSVINGCRLSATKLLRLTLPCIHVMYVLNDCQLVTNARTRLLRSADMKTL